MKQNCKVDKTRKRKTNECRVDTFSTILHYVMLDFLFYFTTEIGKHNHKTKTQPQILKNTTAKRNYNKKFYELLKATLHIFLVVNSTFLCFIYLQSCFSFLQSRFSICNCVL